MQAARASLRATGGRCSPTLWYFAVVTSCAQRNARVISRRVTGANPSQSWTSPHVALFNDPPDISALLPFYSVIAAFDSNPTNGRFVDKAVLARYLAPAADYGTGAIYVLYRDNLRVVKKFCFLARPHIIFDINTLTSAPHGRDIATALMNGEASVPTFALTARISLPIVPSALFATAISEIAPGPIGIV